MKKIILFIFCIFFNATAISVFDLSPWLVIDNTTPLTMTCKVEIVCYQSNYQNKSISLITNNNDNIFIQYSQNTDVNNQNYMHITINVPCKAESTIALNPILSCDDRLINPEITEISFTQESLQLTYVMNPTIENRYFIINYESYEGITITEQPISIYIKCLNSFKQIVYNTVAAIIDAGKWLSH